MMKCDPFARAQCPHGAYCEAFAVYTDESECAKFNQKIMLERDTTQPAKPPAKPFEWVSVKERLPVTEPFTVNWDDETISGESSEPVLVADSNGNTAIACYETGPVFQGWTEALCQTTLHDVTYWAEIPAPPKEATP